MKQKRVHVLSTVNAANVSKTGATYTIRDVCGAVDEIVMNSVLYPGDQLAAGISSMEGRPAPAGHPKDAEGRFISALNADALLTSYCGAVCRNARHEAGRSLVDIVVNESQAKAHPDGAKLIGRLDAAINGANIDPIHVSTGLLMSPVTVNGESRGKKYKAVATNIKYDHLAILLNERGAGTPADGVGMWLNSAGEAEEVEEVALDAETQDARPTGLRKWIARLLGNSAVGMDFDRIKDGLCDKLPDGAWLLKVNASDALWIDADGKSYRQGYAVANDGSLAWLGKPVELNQRPAEFSPATLNEESDQVKDKLIAALNAAGIQNDGMSEDALLAAYSALQRKPVEEKLTAANAKIAEFEQAAQAAANAERDALVAELVANTAGSVLSADDYKGMSLDVLRKLKAAGKGAAPVVAGNSQSKGSNEWAAYDLNAFHKEAK